jgi:hypothetical protein
MGEIGGFTASRGVSSDSSALGTRFLLYAQPPHVSGYSTPEVVWISTPPNQLIAGPADRRIYVRDPVLEKEPYDFPYLPPFYGETFAPVQSGPDGHFDDLLPGTRQFVAAHAFASVCRVMDIWESYLGRGIEWHFADTYERLEIVPWLNWHNAQSGYGFLELGVDRAPDGSEYPFALNFDVIAHEIGHAIQFSLIGVPSDSDLDRDFRAFHEAGADIVSLLSFLHFDSGLDRLLRHCSGNLLVVNELNRIGELAGERQIRLASNSRRLSDVSNEIHDRSRPFTGAVFDSIVDSFHRNLVDKGYADERLLDLDLRSIDEEKLNRISKFTSQAFRARPLLFKSALAEARDSVALALAAAWTRLTADDLTFESVASAMMEVSSARLSTTLEENFVWREIL